MAELPTRLNGFLRALCAISNGIYPEGGMSVTYHVNDTVPPTFPENISSNDATMEAFFNVALGVGNAPYLGVADHIVQELRRVLRDDTGTELIEVQVENDPGKCWSTLSLRWTVGGVFHAAILFWSLD